MDLELYNKIRSTPCKIHQIFSIKNSNNIINIDRDDYILTIKANSLLNQFESYSQFREEFLNVFKNIDCYKITKFLNLHNLLKNVEVSNINGEEDFNNLKNSNGDRYLVLSGIVLVDTNKEKSIIGFSSLVKLIPNTDNPTESALTYATKQVTIESYNTLYELALDEDVKIENIEIL